ncbi:hypothetical protein Tco_0736859 [Tanacetum coccineum]
MAKTMEQYMSKTRVEYGSGVVRPKIEDKDNFELKGQFLKELHTNTFSGSDHEDANEHILKVLEIVNLFHIPNITIDQVMLREFPISLTGAEVILFYNGLGIPTRQILDSRGAIPSKNCVETIGSKEDKDTEGNGLAAIQAQLNNLGREIKKVNEKVYAAQVGCEQCKGPHYTKDCPLKEEGKTLEEAYYTQTTIPFLSHLNGYYHEEKKGSYGPQFLEAYSKASHINNSIPRKEKDPWSFTLPCFINNVCFDNALVDLGASVSVMRLLTYLNLGLGELAHTKLKNELAERIVKDPKGIAKNILVGIGKFTFPVDFIILDMPEDIKMPLILGRPFFSTARAKINFYKRKITLRVEEERIVFTSVKPASSLIKRVYMLSLRERMELDLEARLMGETLVIKEGEVIKEFRTRDDEIDAKFDDYPSYCDYNEKIHIDCAHNLKFSCMIGFEFTHANFFPLLYVNVMSKEFYNSIMKDKMVYKRNNVIGALMNVPIFVGTFFVVTDFAVLENMDAYRDERIGDVIIGEPFLRAVGIKLRRFEEMITIYNGNDEVTYQMVRSHPRFKHYTNEKCNKIPPLLKVSKEDKMNVISHLYQKLKGIYKGVLNLGPDYIRDAKMKE